MIVLRKFVSTNRSVRRSTNPVILSLVFIVSGLTASTVVAQSHSETLLQMQAMQQEIAELRDMIERQGYQIEQLTRSNRSQQAVEYSANTKYYFST